MSRDRARAALLVFSAFAAALASCVSEPAAPEVAPRLESWRFEEAPLGISVQEAPEGEEIAQDSVPGMNPDLGAPGGRTMLPGNRIRRADGSVELYYLVPYVDEKAPALSYKGFLARHYIGLIERWCMHQPTPDGPAVLYTSDPAAAAAVVPPQRAVLLEAADLADKAFTSTADLSSFGPMGLYPGFGALSIPMTEAIHATGHPEDIDALEAFLRTFIVDVDQIEITARVVEAALVDLTDLGAATSIEFVGSGNRFFRGMDASFPNETSLGGVFTLQGIQSDNELESTLQWLRQRTGVKFLSQPRILMRNGSAAALVRGDKVPVQTVVAVSSNNVVSTGIRYEDVGLQLKIAAFAFGRDAVFLDVEIQNGAITGFATVGSVTNPVITQRVARTSVTLKQGESLVIGGLIVSSTEERISKVPILGDIPLLGIFFRSTFESESLAEVNFIFTPRVAAGGSPVVEG
jgi:type II secretory pathway component GspD/PulD (secretin)